MLYATVPIIYFFVILSPEYRLLFMYGWAAVYSIWFRIKTRLCLTQFTSVVLLTFYGIYVHLYTVINRLRLSSYNCAVF